MELFILVGTTFGIHLETFGNFITIIIFHFCKGQYILKHGNYFNYFLCSAFLTGLILNIPRIDGPRFFRFFNYLLFLRGGQEVGQLMFQEVLLSHSIKFDL